MSDDKPADQPGDTKICPDCAAENGDDGRQPLSEFYRTRAARYAGGYRYSAYCKTHAKRRTAQAARDAPEGSKLRESQRKTKREWAQHHPENARTNSANYRARKQKAVEQAGQVDQGGRTDQAEQLDQAEG